MGDGWSFNGTQTAQVNGQKKGLQDSMPNKRHILRFDVEDTVHLRIGLQMNLIINPKECVVCMDKARSIHTECGHFVLCSVCFERIAASKSPRCPICYAPMKSVQNKKGNRSKNEKDLFLS